MTLALLVFWKNVFWLRRVLMQLLLVLIYFLRDSGFIVKDACEHRAPYNISAKGKLLLEALS